MTLQRDDTLRDGTGVVESEGAALLSDEIELAQLIVTTLNLDINPADIDPAAPLYGEGLGLDSIDILEISLAISKKYGVKLRSDSADNRQTFRSLRSLCRYIRERRKP
jgi:acyl carrier protein